MIEVPCPVCGYKPFAVKIKAQTTVYKFSCNQCGYTTYTNAMRRYKDECLTCGRQCPNDCPMNKA